MADDGITVSHVGLCVADLDASLRFWCGALGFEPVGEHDVGEEFAVLMEVPDARVRSRMVRRDGLTVELLAFDRPGVDGDGTRRPMNRRGLTHLSLRVDDLERAAAAVEAGGGTVVRSTRTSFDLPGARLDFVYCTDPDGVRVELMELPGGPPGAAAPSGTVVP